MVDRLKRPRYIDHSLLRLSAFIHLIIGCIILIASGFILFSLPAFVFYISFIAGFYFFLPGIVITFGLVNRRGARNWARYMLPLWRWLGQ